MTSRTWATAASAAPGASLTAGARSRSRKVEALIRRMRCCFNILVSVTSRTRRAARGVGTRRQRSRTHGVATSSSTAWRRGGPDFSVALGQRTAAPATAVSQTPPLSRTSSPPRRSRNSTGISSRSCARERWSACGSAPASHLVDDADFDRPVVLPFPAWFATRHPSATSATTPQHLPQPRRSQPLPGQRTPNAYRDPPSSADTEHIPPTVLPSPLPPTLPSET